MKEHYFLAFDLGASSGRALLGSLKNEKLVLTEIHRFNNHNDADPRAFLLEHLSAFHRIKGRIGKVYQRV